MNITSFFTNTIKLEQTVIKNTTGAQTRIMFKKSTVIKIYNVTKSVMNIQ